jgi:hypothetical protein
MSLFLIADIDSPRRGLIRVHPQTLESVAESLRPLGPGAQRLGAFIGSVPNSAYGAGNRVVIGLSFLLPAFDGLSISPSFGCSPYWFPFPI